MPTKVSLEDLSLDQLLERARTTEGVAATVHAIANNPTTRESWLRLLKQANPGLSLPEIDAKDAVLGEVGKLTKTVETLQNQILERDARDRVERGRADIKRKYNLTDDDVGAVEALMIDKDNPIPSYDAAARVHVASRISAVPSAASFVAPTYQMPEKDVWGGGIGKPATLNRIALDQAYQAWGEIQSGKVAGMTAH